MNYYTCGSILTTHGIKGDLKVKNFSDFDRFKAGARLYIHHGKDYLEVNVLKASVFGEYYLVRFKDLEDINLVERFHGDDICISEEDRKETGLKEGQFYYSDLVGKRVINEKGEERGVIKAIEELPAARYLIIAYQDREVMVPFIEKFIGEVSDAVTIKEIEGLF